jgi:hypothetical protein
MDTMTKNLVNNVESSLRRNRDNTPETSLQIDKFKKSVQSEESEIDEKWSKKYKESIDCSNPKGFSQKAHCQGKKKKETNEKSDKRKKKEAVEATSSASSGQYSAPLFSLETPKDPLSKVTKVQESTVIGGGN